MIKTKKALSIVEYSMLIAVVVAALIGMQFYLRRAICGKWKEGADSFGFGRQYGKRGIFFDTQTTTEAGNISIR